MSKLAAKRSGVVVIIFSSLCFLTAGCRGPKEGYRIFTTAAFDPTEVWEAVIEEVSTQYPIEAVAPGRRTLMTGWVGAPPLEEVTPKGSVGDIVTLKLSSKTLRRRVVAETQTLEDGTVQVRLVVQQQQLQHGFYGPLNDDVNTYDYSSPDHYNHDRFIHFGKSPPFWEDLDPDWTAAEELLKSIHHRLLAGKPDDSSIKVKP